MKFDNNKYKTVWNAGFILCMEPDMQTRVRRLAIWLHTECGASE